MSSSEHKLSEKVAEGGMLDTGLSTDVVDHKNGAYAEIKDVENPELGMFDKPLPCFGCGIGWFSWVLTALLSMCACVCCGWVFLCTCLCWSMHLLLQSSARIGVPIVLVLCDVSLLSEILPERSKGARWTCCQCSSCKCHT